jgi:hypothetical protein
LRFATGTTITVSGDMTQDIARPALPHLFAVQGKITSPDANLQPPYLLNIQMIKDENGSPLSDATSVSTSPISADGSYYALLPVGEYSVTARATSSASIGTPALLASPNIQVNGVLNTQNLTVSAPSPVTLSGAVTQNAQAAVNWNVFAALANPVANGIQNNFSQVQNGQYSMELTAGTYDLMLSLLADEASDNSPMWLYQAGTVNLQSSTTHSIQIPSLPTGMAKVTGKVLGPDGTAITKGEVAFLSPKLDNADGSLSYDATVPISATGEFSAILPLGEYSAHVLPDLGIDVADIETASPIGDLPIGQ